MTTLINILSVAPADQQRLLALLHDNVDSVIRTLDGWIGTSLIASTDGTRVIIHSDWRDPGAVAAMRVDPRMMAAFPRIAALASFESVLGEVVYATSA